MSIDGSGRHPGPRPRLAAGQVPRLTPAGGSGPGVGCERREIGVSGRGRHVAVTEGLWSIRRGPGAGRRGRTCRTGAESLRRKPLPTSASSFGSPRLSTVRTRHLTIRKDDGYWAVVRGSVGTLLRETLLDGRSGSLGHPRDGLRQQT